MADKRPAHRKGTTGRVWRRVRNKVINSTDICWICGKQVRRDVPPTHPLAPTADHTLDLQYGGSAQDARNLRLAHFGCNSRRGAQSKRRTPQRKSWDW